MIFISINRIPLRGFSISQLNIVLAPGAESDQSVSLDAVAAEKLELRLSGNTMAISSLKAFPKQRLTVYLYVNNLKSITVQNNTTVKTTGVLDAPNVDIFIDGEAMGHLRTKGKIKAYSLDDSEIMVKYLAEDLLALNKR